MSAIKHPNLKAELLYLIGRASAPLSAPELYERSELADDIVKVSKALWNLQSDGKVVRAPGEGRARYQLAAGVATPAPAGKSGRSKAVQKDDAAAAAAAEPSQPAADHVAGAGNVIETPAPVRPEPVEGLPEDPKTLREKGKVEAAFHRAKKSTARAFASSDASLADAILARLKRDLAPTAAELETALIDERLNVHIHIEQVDIHLGGL